MMTLDRRTLLASATVLALAAALGYALVGAPSSSSGTAGDASAGAAGKLGPNLIQPGQIPPTRPTLFMPEKLMAPSAGAASAANGQQRTADATAPSLQPTADKRSLMNEVPVATIAHLIPPEDGNRAKDGRRWIRYEQDVLTTRKEGDRFLLALPGEGTVEAEIDRVEVLDNLRRVSGRMVDATGGSFVITQSPDDKYAIGHFTVPGAEMLMEVKRGLGWVAMAANEFRLEGGKSDAVALPANPAGPNGAANGANGANGAAPVEHKH